MVFDTPELHLFAQAAAARFRHRGSAIMSARCEALAAEFESLGLGVVARTVAGDIRVEFTGAGHVALFSALDGSPEPAVPIARTPEIDAAVAEANAFGFDLAETLLLQTLGDRWALGDAAWTFDVSCAPIADALVGRGLIEAEPGPLSGTLIVQLTEVGRALTEWPVPS